MAPFVVGEEGGGDEQGGEEAEEYLHGGTRDQRPGVRDQGSVVSVAHPFGKKQERRKDGAPRLHRVGR